MEPSAQAILVLVGALVLFASGRLRHDVVALLILVAVALLGLVPEAKIFEGFGHPAVITVAAVLIMSSVMSRSGVVEIVADRLEPYTENQAAHLLVLCGVVAALSAFINNVGALALMMPVALATAKTRGRNPSILLMPLAFAAILGGMTTLIGTPPNIIIASIRAESAADAPFGLFDFTAHGLPVAVAGVLFVALVGWRLLPKDRQAANPQEAIVSVGGYVAELRLSEESDLVGRSVRESGALAEPNVRILSVIRTEPSAAEGAEPKTIRLPALPWRRLAAGDVLVVEAEPEIITQAIDAHKLTVAKEREERKLDVAKELDWRDASLVEVVISAGSPLIGRSARLFDRVTGERVSLLAISRQGARIRKRVREETLQSGDVALLQGDPELMNEILERYGLLPLASRGLSPPGRPDGAPLLATAFFAGAILLSVAGVAPIGVALTLAVVASLLAGLLPLRELYDGVDWPVIVLLGAMFPLGMALETTGATAMIAGGIVGAAEGLPGWAVLTLILVATMGLSDVINNAATAVLMAPLSITVAEKLGYASDPFLMAVALGASCAFLTPIGHQCNTLVMGPGGYKFTDYWRMGLPLEVVVTAVGVPLILVFWPL